MTAPPHLTEEERQSLADGSLAAERQTEARSHLAQCAECAGDVRRLEVLMKSMRTAQAPRSDIDALWPDIRSRIEARKLVTLSAAEGRRIHRGLRWGIVAAAAAAAIALFAMPMVQRQRVLQVAPADSLQSYEAEARVLLNHLELERATMRPEAVALIDRDLKTIDSAIDELRLALASDPKNPALRRLLASSYRQKVELLKRAQNAS